MISSGPTYSVTGLRKTASGASRRSIELRSPARNALATPSLTASLVPLAREFQRAGGARAVGAGDHLERLAADRPACRLSQLHRALARPCLGGAERVGDGHLGR